MIRDGRIQESEETLIRLGSASINRKCVMIIMVISIGNSYHLEARTMG